MQTSEGGQEGGQGNIRASAGGSAGPVPVGLLGLGKEFGS